MIKVTKKCLTRVLLLVLCVLSPVAIADEITEVEHKSLQRLILNKECRIDSPSGLSEFLAPFIPGLIDSTVGSIIGAIKKAGEDSTKTIEVNHSDFFYVLDNNESKRFYPKHGCLTVVIGTAMDDPKRLKPETSDDDISSAITEIANYFPTSDYGDGFEIDVLYEVRIENAPDNRSFRLVANALYVDKYLHKSRSSRSRNYLLTVDLKKPNTEAGKAYASIVLPLIHKIDDDSYIGSDTLQKMAIHSRWVPYPNLSDASKAQLAKVVELKTSEANQKKKQEVADICGTPPSYADDCLKKMYPFLKSSTNKTVTKMRTLRTQLDQQKEALKQAKLNELNAPGKRAAEVTETEQVIEKLITQETNAALLGCTKVNRRRLQHCLGAPQTGNAPTCANPEVAECKLMDTETAGAEFMTWSAAITETRPGSKFMKKLGGILESGQEGFVGELKKKFDPATIAATEKEVETSFQASVTLQDKLRQAKQQVDLKTLSLNDATTDLARRTTEFEIINKKHEANEIARQLGLPVPYSDI